MSNCEFKSPVKFFIFFIVPCLSNNERMQDKLSIDSYQPTYEKLIYRALQVIEHKNITTLAMPVLEPSGNHLNFHFDEFEFLFQLNILLKDVVPMK